MHAIACILSCDGCSGMPVIADGLDILTTMVDDTNLGKQATGTKRLGKRPKGSLAELVYHKDAYRPSKGVGGPSRINPRPVPPFT